MRKLDVKQLAVRFTGGSDTPYDATYINFEDETVTFVMGGHKFGHPVTARFDEVEFFEKPKPVEVRFKVRGKFTGVQEEFDLKDFYTKKRFLEVCKEAIDRVLWEELENAPLDSMTDAQIENMDDVDNLLWITVLNQSELDENLWIWANNLLEQRAKEILEDRNKEPEVYAIRIISHNCNAEFETDFTRENMQGIKNRARAMIRNDVKAKKQLHSAFGVNKGEIEMACSEPAIQKMIHEYYDNYHHKIFVRDVK
ncbi:hypothetical protein [Bacillus phage YungSlug]|nr:hypothetical protein [Bacillus phage YungSlug]